MNTHEQESHTQEAGRRRRRWGPGRWNCCQGIGSENSDCCDDAGMRHGMARCFRGCRYFLLIPVVVAVVFLALGYYLDPETIRVLWIVNAAIVAAMALIGVLVMWRFAAGSGPFGCCGFRSRGKS